MEFYNKYKALTDSLPPHILDKGYALVGKEKHACNCDNLIFLHKNIRLGYLVDCFASMVECVI